MRRLGIIDNKDGAVLVYVALLLFVLIGLSALAIDLGQMYIAREKAQNVCDASALAGAWHMDPSNPSTLALPSGPAEQSAQDCALANDENRKWIAYQIDSIATEGVTVSFPNNTTIRTDCQVPVNYIFAGIFGKSGRMVSATAQATLETEQSANFPLFPIAFPASVVQDASFGVSAVIKPDNWQDAGIGSGNWRPISFPGDSGGNDYSNRLAGNGAPVDVSVGDWVNTLPGQKLGPTIQGLSGRLSDPGWAEWSTTNQTDGLYAQNSRLVLAPVIADTTTNGSGQVQIIGFVGFFIENVSQSDKTISGYFVGSVIGTDPSSIQWIDWMAGSGQTNRLATPRLIS